MRAGSSLVLRVFIAALLCPAAVNAAGAKGRSDRPARVGVTVRVDQRAYGEGVPVKVEVTNRLGERVFLHGCASYAIERFVDDRFVPLAPLRCEWEEDAIALETGSRTFEFSPPHDERSIYRLVVTYGLGCREGVPLSRAQCARFGTAYSSTFVSLQTPEP
jgi:hypothetical protein